MQQALLIMAAGVCIIGIAFLMHKEGLGAEAATELAQRSRAIIDPSACGGFVQLLSLLEAGLKSQ